MKQIAITGGKGGVGKSTFSVLLSGKLIRENKKVVLCDCDVECPNDHLLLGVSLDSPIDKVYAQFPKLVEDRCRGCGLCAEKCTSNAIFMPRTTSGQNHKGFTPSGSGQAAEGARPVFIHELCSGCGLCWSICPYNAIEVEKKEIGEIFVNQLEGDFVLITGRSVGIVDETGPIVEELRKFAEDYAEKAGADYLLLDTAPGLHCDVIRALWKADKAYAVTEPTPLGAHDLSLILQLLQRLDIPTEVVLNQADLGDKGLIARVLSNFDFDISLEVPYSKEIVEAYSKGDLLQVNVNK